MIASRNPPPHVGGYGLFRASNGPWRPAEVGADAAVSEVVESWLRMLVVEGFGVSLLFLLGNAFRWWSELAPSHSPVREKLLRSPGESLRRNLEQLSEYLVYSVAVFLLVPTLFAWQAPIFTKLWAGAFLAGLMVLCALPGLWVMRLHRNYALGLRAERAVGEELNLLMLDNCHVFHDCPVGPDWNIGHIVVAPSGVYAIETRTFRRGRASRGLREYEVVFDGTALLFPRRTRTEPVRQARRSAAALSEELSGALAEPIEVKSMLTLPGWRLARRADADVLVVNPKEIWPAIVTAAPPVLSDSQIQRISYYLQQKCRDVEI